MEFFHCRAALVTLLSGLGILCSAARANDIYIAQAASGANSGQSCADAYAYTFFNTSTNWGSGNPIAPGTVVHICGIVTAPAGASGFLEFKGSGAAGNPITLRFEPGAALQAPFWGANGAIYSFSRSNIAIDGGTNGVLQATANGTGLANQQDGKGVFLNYCNTCEVKNLTVSNLYVHTAVTDEAGSSSYGIYIQSGNSIALHGNTIHDANKCLQYAYAGGTTSADVRIFSNIAYNCNAGVNIGSANTGAVLTNVLIYGNVIHDFVNWDDSLNNNHHDGIHVWAAHTLSSISGLQIYNNRIYGDWGIHCTASIYVEGGPGLIDSFFVFNNDLGATNSAVHVCGNGFISSNNTTNGLIAHNTITSDAVSTTSGYTGSATGITIVNNVFYGIRTAIYSPAAGSLASSDRNDFFGLGTAALYYGGKWYSDLPSWRAGTGFDTHSFTLDPLLNASHQPLQGSPVIGAGANLSGLGIAALTLDINGLSRLASWDMGAFLHTAGVMAPPTSLTATPK